jgi:hypothetical protein
MIRTTRALSIRKRKNCQYGFKIFRCIDNNVCVFCRTHTPESYGTECAFNILPRIAIYKTRYSNSSGLGNLVFYNIQYKNFCENTKSHHKFAKLEATA